MTKGSITKNDDDKHSMLDNKYLVVMVPKNIKFLISHLTGGPNNLQCSQSKGHCKTRATQLSHGVYFGQGNIVSFELDVKVRSYLLILTYFSGY